MAANAVFNTHDVCVALMTQPNIVASDIAALACVNKTALRAARESRGGWRALLTRTLPHASKRDPVVALRAYKEVANRTPDVAEAMDCKLVVLCATGRWRGDLFHHL